MVAMVWAETGSPMKSHTTRTSPCPLSAEYMRSLSLEQWQGGTGVLFEEEGFDDEDLLLDSVFSLLAEDQRFVQLVETVRSSE